MMCPLVDGALHLRDMNHLDVIWYNAAFKNWNMIAVFGELCLHSIIGGYGLWWPPIMAVFVERCLIYGGFAEGWAIPFLGVFSFYCFLKGLIIGRWHVWKQL